MSDLFDRNYNCSICGNQFTSKQVKKSAIKTKLRERDFHAYYSGASPVYYGVICCPNCGYAKFEKDFLEDISPAEKSIVKDLITKNWRYQNFCEERDLQNTIKVHLIALANYKILKASTNILGKLYLRLAWFYRELENQEDELKYIKLAIDSFQHSFENEKLDIDPEKEIEIIYLVGELNRRIGNYKEAIQWFSNVVNHEFAYKTRMIKGYARDQWELSAEAYKLEKAKNTNQGA